MRTELKVLQKASAKKVEKQYPIKFVPANAFAMPATQLHMLLTLVVAQDASVLAKSNVSSLKALLTAYAAPDAKPNLSGTKDALLERVTAAVRAAGTAGFARGRAPVFEEKQKDAGAS